jgi:DNA-binding NarL/FixJ family response regulator
VLIVDDHPGFRQAARALLAARGFAVVAETDCAVGALHVAARLEPDAVLLDVRLGVVPEEVGSSGPPWRLGGA